MVGTITLELTGGAVRPLRMLGDYDLKVVCGRFTFDSDYVTAGESLAPSDINLTEINTIIFTPALCSTTVIGTMQGAIMATYDYTNNKVIALIMSAGATSGVLSEASNDLVLSAYTTRFIAIGY